MRKNADLANLIRILNSLQHINQPVSMQFHALFFHKTRQ